MASSSQNTFEESLDDTFDQYFDQTFENFTIGHQEETRKQRKKWSYIERKREEGHIRLWDDYFSETPTYPENFFRWRFRMKKSLFMHIVDRLSNKVQYFREKKDCLRRISLSPLQKCIAAIHVLAYGYAADTVDEYLRLGETTTRFMCRKFCGRNNTFVRRRVPKKINTSISSTSTWYWRASRISRDDRKHGLYALGVEELFHRLERAIFSWFR